MTARVLVVDDVELNVKLLEAKLSSEYFQVIPAYNGPSALELADAELPDIILLDGRNSEETRAALAAIPTWTSLPAVKAGQVHTWHAGAPYSYRSYAEILDELADELSDSRAV